MADRIPTNQAEFDAVVHSLKMELLRALGAVEHLLPNGKVLDPSPEATVLEADWRGLNAHLDGAMACHDKIASMIGFHPRHERFLRGR